MWVLGTELRKCGPCLPRTLSDLEGHEKVQAWILEVHHSVDQKEKTPFLRLYTQGRSRLLHVILKLIPKIDILYCTENHKANKELNLKDPRGIRREPQAVLRVPRLCCGNKRKIIIKKTRQAIWCCLQNIKVSLGPLTVPDLTSELVVMFLQPYQ